MQVILLEKVQNLGVLGDQVAVKSGYARNYLIPFGKAVFATKDNVEKFEQRRAELEKLEQEKLEAAKVRAEKLEGLTIELIVRASDEGKLYGSLGTREIAEAISAKGEEVQKREVNLPEGPVRHTGEHTVRLQLHSDVNVDIIVNVAPEE